MVFEFFRRYQRVVFVVVTVVIVISFSFFGTFQAFTGNNREDTVAFTAVDGTAVRQSELTDMATFLGADIYDQFSVGIPWVGNGLNDGVIAHDIFQTGLIDALMLSNSNEIAKELQPKLDREKRYVPYKHPQASFLSAELLWAYYAPDIKNQYDLLRAETNANSKEALQARVALFLAERRFPPAYLKQVLAIQQSSHKWLPQDATLPGRDLSLFGYHNVQDWFGRNFVLLASQFIINAAKIAEQRGYTVSKDEAAMVLFQNAERAFKDGGERATFGVSSAVEYYYEQLRRLGMDQSRAVRVWTQIMEFRRIFFENAESVLVSKLPYKDFFDHLNEYVDIELYELPQECVFKSLPAVHRAALYLEAVQSGTKGQSPSLDLERPILLAEEIKKVHPELVQREFTLRWASVNKDLLQTKVGVRQLWQWQVQDENWQKLQTHFGELLKAATSHPEERLSLLDSLSSIGRTSVDNFSRAQIVDEHPEWIAEFLEELPMKEEVVFLREQGGKAPFEGIKNTGLLIQLLDKVALDEQANELRAYTQDDIFFFRIQVKDRSSHERVLTLKEAEGDGTLAKLYDQTLEAAYSRMALQNPGRFMNAIGEKKPFSEVKTEIATLYFESLERELSNNVRKIQQKNVSLLPKDHDAQLLAAVFTEYVGAAQKTLVQGSDESLPIRDADTTSIEKQFNLMKTKKRILRGDSSFAVDPTIVFSSPEGTVSLLSWYAGSGPHFYKVVERGTIASSELLRQKVFEERELISNALLLVLAEQLVSDMQKKKALGFSSNDE